MSIETERKFLIELPDPAALAADHGCRVRQIRQTYLRPLPEAPETERRVRSIEEDGVLTYVYTEKTKLPGTKMSREENERGITEEEYRKLYAERVTELTKTRYAFPYGSRTVEIDVYPYEIGGDALVGRAVLEVELESESEPVVLPPEIRVLRELTGTREFSNKAMAKPCIADA